MFTLQEQKENLALSYIANSGAQQEAPFGYSIDESTAEFFYSKIQKALKQSHLLDGKFTFVWGPAALERNDSSKVDHIVYIVRNSNDPNDYRLVIRGSVTSQNWTDNLDVFRAEKWETMDKMNQLDPYASNDVLISHGMYQATKTIIEGKSNNLPGYGLTIKEFLTGAAFSSTGKLNLTVCGMSLGGCIASTLYVLLKQHFSNTAIADKIHIRCCTFGAPTAGNNNFATYLQTISTTSANESSFLRIANDNDIVTLAWENTGLKAIKTIYDSVCDWKTDKTVVKIMAALTLAIPLLRSKKYTQPNLSEHFEFELNPTLTNWLEQAVYQHVLSYPQHYGLSFIVVDADSDDRADIVVVKPGSEIDLF